MTKTADETFAKSDPADPGTAAAGTPVLIVTGMSGAGKTAALKALEDMGYEAVDNLPLSMLSGLVQATNDPDRAIAIGVDIRTRDFAVPSFIDELDRLMALENVKVALLFLDCEDEVLRRRYTETRRRHPLAADRPVMDGIRHERRLMLPLRDRADTVVDTSDFSLAVLQRVLNGHFGLDKRTELTIFVTSFSFRRGVPRESDLVLDVRFLSNPHYDEMLRPLTGQDAEVARFIEADPDFRPFFDSLTAMLAPLIPRYRAEGKSYLTISIGCTGGRHRSVFVAEALTSWLRREETASVDVSHRDIH